MFQLVSDSLFQLAESFRVQKRARLVFFYISLSPVFLTPIFFLYLENEMGLNPSAVLRISALYALFSLVLDIPMGICADQFGAKSTLYGGLICYIAGIAFLLTLPNPWSYHLYYLLTSIGFPCMSGADMSLIRQHWGAEDGSFKSHVFALQKWSYLIIASLYLFTPMIYSYSKKLPFLLQIGLLVLSIFNLRGMRAHKSKAQSQRDSLFSDFALAVRLCVLNRKYFLLLVCSSVFGLGISINHKVIQKQLVTAMQAASGHQTMELLGIIYSAASLCSALGTTALAAVLRGAGLSQQILTLLSMLSAAFLAMSVPKFSTIIVGFLLINLFKGGFRPLLNAELTNQMPFQRLTAQTISFTSFVSALFLILMQLGLSYAYQDPVNGNFFYACMAPICVLLAFAYAKFPYTWQIAEQRSRGRRKRALICKNGAFHVLQFYPRTTSRKNLQQLINASERAIYPAPVTSWYEVEQGYCVQTPFLGDVTLSQIRDSSRQKTLCKQILGAHRKSHAFESAARCPSLDAVFVGDTLAKVQKSTLFNLQCDIHGQLKPTNIIVVNRECRVVKWGASGQGGWWWDVLTLLAHPDLLISPKDRLSLICHFTECKIELTRDILLQFSRYKAKSIQAAFPETDSRELVKRHLRVGENCS